MSPLGKRPARLTLIALLAIAGLVTAAWLGPRRFLEARATRSWPTADGVVESASVVRRTGSGARRWTVDLRYRFTVDGREYSGTRWDVGGRRGTPTPAAAQELAARYAPGTSVRVHYDPTRPERCVLEPGGESAAGLLILFGVLLCATSGWYAWRNMRT